MKKQETKEGFRARTTFNFQIPQGTLLNTLFNRFEENQYDYNGIDSIGKKFNKDFSLSDVKYYSVVVSNINEIKAFNSLAYDILNDMFFDGGEYSIKSLKNYSIHECKNNNTFIENFTQANNLIKNDNGNLTHIICKNSKEKIKDLQSIGYKIIDKSEYSCVMGNNEKYIVLLYSKYNMLCIRGNDLIFLDINCIDFDLPLVNGARGIAWQPLPKDKNGNDKYLYNIYITFLCNNPKHIVYFKD